MLMPWNANNCGKFQTGIVNYHPMFGLGGITNIYFDLCTRFFSFLPTFTKVEFEKSLLASSIFLLQLNSNHAIQQFNLKRNAYPFILEIFSSGEQR